jgi:hypothetical protein
MIKIAQTAFEEHAKRLSPVRTKSTTELTNMNVQEKITFGLAGAMAAVIVIAGAMSMIYSRPAAATTQYAAQTGKPCAQCHQNPTGGTELTPFGNEFKANAYELPKEAPKDPPK